LDLAHYGHLLIPDRLIQLQRVAQFGALTMQLVLDGANDGGKDWIARLGSNADGWNRSLSVLFPRTCLSVTPGQSEATSRIGIGPGTGGQGSEWTCLFWICEEWLVCGLLPGSSWPTCFWAEVCYCAISEPIMARYRGSQKKGPNEVQTRCGCENTPLPPGISAEEHPKDSK
jgi:hypothetical protein